MSRDPQHEHPHTDPVADPNARPKVDAGDSGATVGGSDGPDTSELEGIVAEEHAKGYRGLNPDPTPNEAYTVAGVTAGPDEEVVPESEQVPADPVTEPAAAATA